MLVYVSIYIFRLYLKHKTKSLRSNTKISLYLKFRPYGCEMYKEVFDLKFVHQLEMDHWHISFNMHIYNYKNLAYKREKNRLSLFFLVFITCRRCFFLCLQNLWMISLDQNVFQGWSKSMEALCEMIFFPVSDIKFAELVSLEKKSFPCAYGKHLDLISLFFHNIIWWW